VAAADAAAAGDGELPAELRRLRQALAQAEADVEVARIGAAEQVARQVEATLEHASWERDQADASFGGRWVQAHALAVGHVSCSQPLARAVAAYSYSLAMRQSIAPDIWLWSSCRLAALEAQAAAYREQQALHGDEGENDDQAGGSVTPLVDRRLLASFLLAYVAAPKGQRQREILTLMANVLHIGEEGRVRLGLVSRWEQAMPSIAQQVGLVLPNVSGRAAVLPCCYVFLLSAAWPEVRPNERGACAQSPPGSPRVDAKRGAKSPTAADAMGTRAASPKPEHGPVAGPVTPSFSDVWAMFLKTDV
jgi:hypothetical protein